MKLNHTKFKAFVQESGVSADQLASALPKKTARRKAAQEAEKKVRNWLAGSDTPRVTAPDVIALADALGCEVMDIARFPSTARWVRSSPRKARLVADLVRGRSVEEAMSLLEFSPKRASVFVRKVLNAAVADAEAADARVDRLYISESRVDEGVIIKRFQPKDRGRAHPIQKKTSHITIAVEERA